VNRLLVRTEKKMVKQSNPKSMKVTNLERKAKGIEAAWRSL